MDNIQPDGGQSLPMILLPSVTLLLLFNSLVLFYFILKQVNNEIINGTIRIILHSCFLRTEKGGVRMKNKKVVKTSGNTSNYYRSTMGDM